MTQDWSWRRWVGVREYIPPGLPVTAPQMGPTISVFWMNWRMFRQVCVRPPFFMAAKVSTVEYDPNRSARIALLTYADGEKRYILQPLGLKVGDTIVAGDNVDILPGNALPLKNIPTGTMIHNIELRPGKGGQMVGRVPVFDTVREALAFSPAEFSIIFVPAPKLHRSPITLSPT